MTIQKYPNLSSYEQLRGYTSYQELLIRYGCSWCIVEVGLGRGTGSELCVEVVVGHLDTGSVGWTLRCVATFDTLYVTTGRVRGRPDPTTGLS